MRGPEETNANSFFYSAHEMTPNYNMTAGTDPSNTRCLSYPYLLIITLITFKHVVVDLISGV